MKLKAAQGIEVTCGSCNRRAQIVLEPSVIGMDLDKRPSDEADVLHCPFCGIQYERRDFLGEEIMEF